MKYIVTCCLATSVFIFVAAGFNWLVDPFGMYWSPSVEGFNALKPESGKRSRITKAYRSLAVRPDVLIVGNSRVEMGLSPKHRLFEGQRVYNLGMPGAGVGMQYDYARNVIAGPKNVNTLIVGVDFLDFLVRPEAQFVGEVDDTTNPSYWSRLPLLSGSKVAGRLFSIREKLKLVLSLEAVKASLITVMGQSSRTNSIDELGFNSAGSYLNILHHEGIRPLYTQKISELKKRLGGDVLTVKPSSKELSAPFLKLSQLLDYAEEMNIKVYLFINPYHYSYVQLLDESGYRDEFLMWKSVLADLASSYSSERIQLWDFSGFNRYTLEAVPLIEPKNEMKWYWEPAHYKKELGDLVLEEMLGDKEVDDFGVILNSNNVEGVIAKNSNSIIASKKSWNKLQSNLDVQ